MNAMVALATPLRADGSLDPEGATDMVEAVINEGVSGIVVAGTTGEWADLLEDEYASLVGSVTDAAAGRVPVIAAVGGASTAQAVHQAREARSAGVTRLLVLPPLYWHLDDEGLVAHFERVAAAAEVPCLAYDIPLAVGYEIPSPVIRRLAAGGAYDGAKVTDMATSRVERLVVDTKAEFPEFGCYVGLEHQILPVVLAGADGAISGLANAVPRLVVELTESLLLHRHTQALELHQRLLALTAVYSAYRPPVQAIKMMAHCAGMPIAPFTRTTTVDQDALRASVQTLVGRHLAAEVPRTTSSNGNRAAQ